MRWLDANRLMVIGDYHRAFCAAFGRADVLPAHLHGLRKRRGWKIGPGLARGRMIGRHTKYSAAEIAWLHDNCTMVISDFHRAFCQQFNRSDVTACALQGFRKKNKWATGRDGTFNKGSVPWSKGKKLGNNPGSARTQFKKGSRGGLAVDLYKPIGFERIAGGYLVRKINDGFPMQARWRAVHLLNWEGENGPIPKGLIYMTPFPPHWAGLRENHSVSAGPTMEKECWQRRSMSRFASAVAVSRNADSAAGKRG
jgi:hypothetical protein